VTGPCGASVVALGSGKVRYDGPTRGAVVGVAAGRLFTRHEASEGQVDIEGTDLATGRTDSSYGSNTTYQDATTAGGSLLTFYGDQLESTDPSSSGPTWSIQVPLHRSPRLLVDGRLVLVSGSDGSTYAVRAGDGTLAWRTVPPVPATFYDMQEAFVPGTVLTTATSYDERRAVGIVYATDSTSGHLRWSRPGRSVIAADRHTTVLQEHRALVAVNTVDGTRLWRREARMFDQQRASAALTPEAVVVAEPGSTALGLDRATGRVRWRGPAMAPVVAVGRLVVGVVPGRVAALDARTGAIRWTLRLEHPDAELAVAPHHHVLVLDTDRVPHEGG
jgi:hypothetical protein